MAVAKRQGREKPTKKEGPRTFRAPQVEQTALLASPIHRGQAQREEKTYKKRSQMAGALSSPPVFGAVTGRCNTDLSESYYMICSRAKSQDNFCPGL